MAGREFWYAEASGFTMFSTLVTAGLVFEGIAAHLLLHRWSPLAAWISSAICVYGLVWVVRAAHSMRTHPILVGEQSVVLQLGFIWRVEIPRDHIAACRRVGRGEALPRKHPGYLRLVAIDEPQWLIELRQPVAARGLYGLSRMVTRIGVSVDDSEAFGSALQT